MLLADLAETSRAVATTTSRSRKVELLADCLRRAGAGSETPVAVSYLSGELRQRRTGVGWAALRDRPQAAELPSITVMEADAAFALISQASGSGSTAQRRRLLSDLLARATVAEQNFLAALVGGELRQGAMEAVMVDAVARAAEVPAVDVRRAVMLGGALPPVAEAALHAGVAGLARFRLQVGRPIQPMLAKTATSLSEALERASPAAVEWKLDGVRVQVHRDRDDVSVFTRSLDDITAGVPEIVEVALALPLRTAVLDGEAIALKDGRPRPFQETASRVARRSDVQRLRSSTPLTSYFFDVLHLDGEDLLGLDGAQRYTAGARVLPEHLRVPRVATSDQTEARAFFADALAHGHEGVVVKSLAAAYEAGRRGAGWVKVKPRHTLDLVVLAAEWGHGRRRGWLSNLHLAARDPVSGGFVMLGKTFKGLTDELLRWQTERLLALAVTPPEGWVVAVRPELVVEVAFDGVQTSPRYPGGMALRFARVLHYRPDKSPAEADSIDAVRAIHEGDNHASG